ncbi:energy-coupling factor ABC transporter permease [Geomonas sp. Red32]|uniref:energy-coupling factor ABC transporter permease n=1 Tax=Geomonas sp. Red32 TaxID=2912856 RepID=UPI00202D000D|nr:energy-coupling factor ABC transporter permease [Geomonas sp. Red32]MCM0081409.1 energy-coupling factor ABC transporter permease [Geomonas sp. Red32]
MHMADALLSPTVGAAMWGVSGVSVAWCASRLGKDPDDRSVPLMGVLGAFLFAAQMINFSIPGTGSSGHLGGGLLLAILLGPQAAFFTVASVLVVQALFFADGGLLALGCNIFNMGFIPAFLVYPFCYRRLAGEGGAGRRSAAIMICAVASLLLGALAVVLETSCSGISELPAGTFATLMLPIHLAIGLVEGAATVAIVSFLSKARPALVESEPSAARPWYRSAPAVILFCALVTAGILSSFASKDPDGLEWSVARATGKSDLLGTAPLHRALARVQAQTAWFPEYGFRPSPKTGSAAASAGRSATAAAGTGAAGLTGTVVTLSLVLLTVFVLKRRKQGHL